jgi:Protein of unknown function (DUF2795)
MFIIKSDDFMYFSTLYPRTYRDSADVAVALGELKSGKAIRNANEVKASEQPSRKGGRTAATSSISAAAIASLLAGIHFPKSKRSLKDYAKKNISKINSPYLDSLSEREYRNMADVEKSVGDLI